MANKYSAATSAQVQKVINGLMTSLGMECDFTQSSGFKFTLEVLPDGQKIVVQANPTDQGLSNPFGAEVNGHNPSTTPQTKGPAFAAAYAALAASSGVSATLVAGTKDIALANSAGDTLAVIEVTSGGVAAAAFSVLRKSATEVTVFAHDAAGDQLATNTSVVKVFNLGTV